MPVILSSFKRYGRLKRHLGFKPRAYSVARYQPKGSRFPELRFLAPPSDMAVSRNYGPFEGYLTCYETNLKQTYTKNWAEIKSWLDSLERDDVTALLCWCPDTDLARQQLKQFGRFACHTGLIGRMLNRHRPDIEVWLDADRLELISTWMPEHKRVIGRRSWGQKTLFNNLQKTRREVAI